MQNWTPTTYGPFGSDRNYVAANLFEALRLIREAQRRIRQTYPHARDDGNQRRQLEFEKVRDQVMDLKGRLIDELEHAYNADGVGDVPTAVRDMFDEPGLVWVEPSARQDAAAGIEGPPADESEGERRQMGC